MTKQMVYSYEFGPFRLNPAERLLQCGSEPIHVTSKAFDVLLLLVQNRGHLVEKGEILRRVWPDTFIEERTIAQNVFMLRKALGESPKDHQYIETVPKRGYRFIATVHEVWSENAEMEMEKYTGARTIPEVKKTDARQDKPIDSLAILPMINVNTDSNVEYLIDGITESIINNLSQLSKLRIIARNTAFRYKRREISYQEIKHRMDVEAVIKGSVTYNGDSLSIHTELVDVTNESQIWSQQYTQKLSDILTTLEDISREISEKLRINLADEEKMRLTKRCTNNAEAYQLYLKGRYFQNKMTEEGLKKSLDFYRQAITKDPDFALAYSGLADSYSLSGLPLDPDFTLAYAELIDGEPSGALFSPLGEAMSKAKAAALKALKIDDTLAEAHASLGFIKYQFDWDWVAAEKSYKRAIELNQNYARAHHWYGMCLRAMGRLEEAEAEAKRAQKLDPLFFIVNVELGRIYYSARQYDRAIKQYLDTLGMDDTFLPAHFRLGQAYVQKGMYEEAIEEFRKAAPLFGNDSEAVAALGFVYAVMGRNGEAHKVLDKLMRRSKQYYVSPYDIAIIYTGLGERKQAFEWLNKAYECRSVLLTGLKVEPMLDSLRSDLRYENLLRRVELAAS
jgi:DNA-binding winged helix-turn-helix (wHTH) protein/Tfp pilus assembly protein PilF